MQTTIEHYQDYTYSASKKINSQKRRLFVIMDFNLFLVNRKKSLILNFLKTVLVCLKELQY